MRVNPQQDGTDDGPAKYNPDRTTTVGGFGRQAVLTTTDLDTIKAQSGVLSVEPQRGAAVDYIQGSAADKYQVTVSPGIAGTRLDLAAGQGINATSTEPQILLPVSYVSGLGFASAADAIGKSVKLGLTNAGGEHAEYPATIIGVQQKGLIGGGGAIMNQTLVQTLYDFQTEGLPAATKERYPVALARFDPAMTTAQLTTLKQALRSHGYIAQTVEDTIGVFKQAIAGIILVLNGFAVIALVAASFGIINTLLMAVQERTKEIGLMKAMGMRGPRIFLLFSIEATLLGFWGSLIGVGVAMVIGRIANRIASNGVLSDLPGLSLLAFPWQTVARTMLLIMVIALLAGTLPAWRASRLRPIEALRYE